MISKTNYTSNLIESIFNKIKTVLGSTYTSPAGETINLTFLGAYPRDIEAYKSNLPLIILDRNYKYRPVQAEQGGRTKYTDNFYVYVIAGGFSDENTNEFMKNELMDKLLFGFDRSTFDFINYDTNSVEGIYNTDAQEVLRMQPSIYSVFEAHKSQILLTVTSVLKNG